MNFTKITRTTHLGELKETILNVDYIVSIKEKTIDPVNLYDADGNIVETKQPTERVFKVIMRGGEYYNISETEYNKLAKTLTK